MLPPGRVDGTSLTPSPGSSLAGASPRMTITPVPDFARSLKWPTKVSPARSRMVSPYEAASMAAWGSVYAHPLAQTVSVAALSPRSDGERTD